MHLGRLCLSVGAILLVEACASLVERDDNCTALSLGEGPVPWPDNSYEFLNSKELSALAEKALTPINYTLSFQNLRASMGGQYYMDYILLDSYDPLSCAAKCIEKTQCQSFNIFFERAPTVKVGDDCVNPPSTTMIKCTFWSTAVTEVKAKNEGYVDRAFVIAIAGSNAYVNARAGDPKSWYTGNPKDSFSAKTISISVSAIVLISMSVVIASELLQRIL